MIFASQTNSFKQVITHARTAHKELYKTLYNATPAFPVPTDKDETDKSALPVPTEPLAMAPVSADNVPETPSLQTIKQTALNATEIEKLSIITPNAGVTKDSLAPLTEMTHAFNVLSGKSQMRMIIGPHASPNQVPLSADKPTNSLMRGNAYPAPGISILTPQMTSVLPVRMDECRTQTTTGMLDVLHVLMGKGALEVRTHAQTAPPGK